MTPIKIFYLEATDRERQFLRRFSFSNKTPCPKAAYGCDASFELGEADIVYTAEGYIAAREAPPASDPRWPTHCKACGRAFTDEDERQLYGRQIYINAARGVRCTLKDAPAGAVWDAWWISERRIDGPTGCAYLVGPDHRALVVRCPDGHDWHIDARAKNCTRPTDDTHQCWVRHGSPEDGTLHVDKAGNTCAAGAGSIQTGKWHGFLHHGELRQA